MKLKITKIYDNILFYFKVGTLDDLEEDGGSTTEYSDGDEGSDDDSDELDAKEDDDSDEEDDDSDEEEDLLPIERASKILKKKKEKEEWVIILLLNKRNATSKTYVLKEKKFDFTLSQYTWYRESYVIGQKIDNHLEVPWLQNSGFGKDVRFMCSALYSPNVLKI